MVFFRPILFLLPFTKKEVENWYIYCIWQLFRILALQITQILRNTNFSFTAVTILSSHMWYDPLFWYSHSVAIPDPEIRSSRRVRITLLHHSNRPDLQISICHCIQYWRVQSYKHMHWRFLLLHRACCYNCCFIPTHAHIYTLKH
jgi:hypothetical protein